MIAGEEDAIAFVDERRVMVGVARRPPHPLRAAPEVDRRAVVDRNETVEVVDATPHRDPRLAHALVDVGRHAMTREEDVRLVDELVCR